MPASTGLRLTGICYALSVAAVTNYGAGAFGYLKHLSALDLNAVVLFAPYDRFLLLATVTLALYIGIWSALLGLRSASLTLGLGALAAGVVGTTAALALLPPDSPPGIGYPPWEIWLLGRCFIYIGAWLITTVGGLEQCLSEEASPWDS